MSLNYMPVWAEIVHPTIIMKRAVDKEFYAIVTARNGKTVLQTPGTHKRVQGLMKALEFAFGASPIDMRVYDQTGRKIRKVTT